MSQKSYGTVSTASDAEAGIVAAEAVPLEKYPASCYSMIAKGSGPTFVFGFFVYVMQFSLLHFLRSGYVSSVVLGGASYSVDAQITQFLAIISFFLLSQSCLGEVLDSLRLCPNPLNAEQMEGNKMLLVSCFLRFVQGNNAVLTTMMLIVTRNSPYAIILSITAVETISRFDDTSFKLARSKRYGPYFETAAKDIEKIDTPSFTGTTTESARQRKILFNIYQILIFSCVLIFFGDQVYHNQNTKTPTKNLSVVSLRVRFPDSSGLEKYSGCYVLPNVDTFQYIHANMTNSTGETDDRLGYCESDSRWVFFSNSTKEDPCDINTQIAQSKQMAYGDIVSASENPWYTPPNQPLQTFFPRLEKDKYCDSLTTTTLDEVLLE